MYAKEDLLQKAVDIAIAAVSGAGDKSSSIVNSPENLANFIQVVYGKLVEINGTVDD